MTLSPKIVLALRSAVAVVGGLALTDCVVRAQPQPRCCCRPMIPR